MTHPPYDWEGEDLDAPDTLERDPSGAGEQAGGCSDREATPLPETDMEGDRCPH